MRLDKGWTPLLRTRNIKPVTPEVASSSLVHPAP